MKNIVKTNLRQVNVNFPLDIINVYIKLGNIKLTDF